MKKYCLFFLVFFSFFVSAQEKFTAFKNPTIKDKKMMVSQLKNHFNLFEKENSAKNYHKKQQKTILKLVKKNHFVLDNSYENFIQSLINNLVISNPNLLSKNTLVLFSDETEPNASYIGYGIVKVNLGLFLIAENETQFQAIIAHELGHQIKNHVENRIESKKRNQTQNQLSIKQNEEFEADSLATLLLKKANKNPQELILVLENAKKYLNNEDELKLETLNKYFTLPNQPFDENWLLPKKYNAQNTNSINQDYLTEINQRIIKIQHSINSDSIKIQKSVFLDSADSELFEKLKKEAQFHQVSSLNYYKEYGLSLYQNLLLLQKKPIENKEFLEEYFLKNIEKLHEAKKYNEFHEFVHFPNIKSENKNYFRFLNLLWNLNEKELKNILAFYSTQKSN